MTIICLSCVLENEVLYKHLRGVDVSSQQCHFVEGFQHMKCHEKIPLTL